MRWAILFLCLGCAGGPLPEPRIISVSPAALRADEAAQLRVVVEAVLPFSIRYPSSPEVTVEGAVDVIVGGRSLGRFGTGEDGIIRFGLPSILPEGTHDLALTWADGRTAVLSAGLRINPGQWPDGYA